MELLDQSILYIYLLFIFKYFQAKNTLNTEPKQVAVKYVHQNKKYKNR